MVLANLHTHKHTYIGWPESYICNICDRILVIYMPEIPYTHRIYTVLAKNPARPARLLYASKQPRRTLSQSHPCLKNLTAMCNPGTAAQRQRPTIALLHHHHCRRSPLSARSSTKICNTAWLLLLLLLLLKLRGFCRLHTY